MKFRNMCVTQQGICTPCHSFTFILFYLLIYLIISQWYSTKSWKKEWREVSFRSLVFLRGVFLCTYSFFKPHFHKDWVFWLDVNVFLLAETSGLYRLLNSISNQSPAKRDTMKRIAKWSIQFFFWSKYRIEQIERYLGVCGIVGGINRHELNSAWCTHNLLKPIWLPGNPESCWCWVFSCVMWGCVWVCVYTYTHVHEVGGSWKLLIDGHFSQICYKPQKQSRYTSQAFPRSPSYFHMHGNRVSDIQMNSLSCTEKNGI